MSARDRVMVVFVDALGPAQLERFGERLAFLPHRRALGGVLGFSSGALASVLTGAPPAAHGRMCLFTARPPESDGVLEPLKWLGLLPRALHERGAVRRLVARALAQTSGLTGYVALHRVPPEAFRWLDIPERDDLFAAPDVGGQRTFLADARDAGLSVYAARWQLPEAPRWADAHAALERTTPDLSFLYSADLDAALHAHGNVGAATLEVIDRIAGNIERAREAMTRGGGELTTIVVGDHGMADVVDLVDPRDVVRRLDGVQLFVDSTMLRVWGDDAALDRARAELDRARWPGRWLDERALDARRAPVRGAPYGRAIFLLDEGVIFAPSWVGGRVAGMHGYDLVATSARAAVASDRAIPEECDSIVAVAGVVRRRLGLPSG